MCVVFVCVCVVCVCICLGVGFLSDLICNRVCVCVWASVHVSGLNLALARAVDQGLKGERTNCCHLSFDRSRPMPGRITQAFPLQRDVSLHKSLVHT